MTAADVLALIGAGMLAGVTGTVAGLASLVSYPVLLAFGLPPLSANVTNTVALTFASAGAAAGSRPELAGQGSRVRRIGLVTALGGAAGASLLLLTPPGAFESVVPALIAGSSLVLLLQPLIRRPGGQARGEGSRPLQAATFVVAIYMGYFGAAGGILMLAALSAMLNESLARINAVKNVVSGLANTVAAIAFAGALDVRGAACRRLPDRRLYRPGHRAQDPGAGAAHHHRRGRPGTRGEARHRRLPVTLLSGPERAPAPHDDHETVIGQRLQCPRDGAPRDSVVIGQRCDGR